MTLDAFLTLDPRLTQVCAALRVGVLTARVAVTAHDAELWPQIDALTPQWIGPTMDEARQRPAIRALRQTYRALGVDPTRYRGSNEALVRRLVQGKALYRVNTVVDLNNLLSLQTLCSCGTIDRALIRPPLVFRPGHPGESYEGIGRGAIKLEGIPVFADATGAAFASTTSDCDRTKVTQDTHELLLLIIDFSGGVDLAAALQRAGELLRRHAAATDVDTQIVGG